METKYCTGEQKSIQRSCVSGWKVGDVLYDLAECPNCKKDTQHWLLLGSLFGVCPECEPIVFENMKKCFYKMGKEIAQRKEQRMIDIISGKKPGAV